MRWEKIVTTGICGVFLGMLGCGVCAAMDLPVYLPLSIQFISSFVILVGLQKEYSGQTIEQRILGSENR